jgi:hypothetical protein
MMRESAGEPEGPADTTQHFTTMNTTALRAALARVDWPAMGRRTIAGLQLCWLVAQLLAAALAVAISWAREHRAELRAAMVAAIAAVVVAAQLTHAAGCATRRWLERLNARAAALVHSQPLPPTAAITAPLQALREALERWVTRLYGLAAGRTTSCAHARP